MRGAGIKHRATHHNLSQPSPSSTSFCEDGNIPERESGSCSSGDSARSSLNYSYFSMREPWLLRTVRIGCVLVLILCVWSSSGKMVATVEMDAKGSVQNIKTSSPRQEQHPQQTRQMSISNHPPAGLPQKSYQHEFDQRQQKKANGALHQSKQGNLQEAEPSVGAPAEEGSGSGECGLYLAPSTIEGGGLGIFSAYHRAKGEIVGNEEVVLPLVELNFRNGNKEDLFNPFVHYYWKGREKALHNIVSEERSNEVLALVPGMEAAVNCNLALINVDMAGSKFDDGNLQRYRDPMAGGMSPYHSTSSRVSRDIPAGGEVFKFYGDRWFVARQEQFGLIPLSEDYPSAERIVNKYDELQRKLFPDNTELQDDLWSLMKDVIGKNMWESRTMNALPGNTTDAKKAAESDIASLHQPHAIRSVEYLRENGKCVDSIRPGPSTLESGQGGRGAFATRSFKKGTIITGSPLNHVPDRNFLTIYKMEQNQTTQDQASEEWLRHVDNIVGYQMSLNYCYGHNGSTMLLCPYGSGVNYINHNQTRANVKIQWAQDGMTLQNDTWLYKKRVEDLEWVYSIGLAFDYVATIDLNEGDELFLDYGDAFEAAITQYFSSWKPSESKDGYIPAQRYNKLISDSPLRTEMEQAEEAYPEHLELRCHSDLVSKQKFDNEHALYWQSREFGVPCRILERYERTTNQQDGLSGSGIPSESVYKVELTVPLDEVGLQYKSDVFTYIQRKDVTRGAIQFFNKPYTSDLFLEDAFRFPIGLPDSMLPEQWRNTAPNNPEHEVVLATNSML